MSNLQKKELLRIKDEWNVSGFYVLATWNVSCLLSETLLTLPAALMALYIESLISLECNFMICSKQGNCV
jgi:hypothetical protein